jgi:hypothetical protein
MLFVDDPGVCWLAMTSMERQDTNQEMKSLRSDNFRRQAVLLLEDNPWVW